MARTSRWRLRKFTEAESARADGAGRSRRARVVMQALVLALVLLGACQPGPPVTLDGVEVPDVYERVLAVVRHEFDIDGPLLIHPYLAIAADSTGRPTVGIDDFDYVPSEALRLVELRDTLLTMCQPGRDGVCPGSRYLILSRPIQTGDQAATIIGTLIDPAGTGRPQYVSVRLRYRGGVWSVAGIAVELRA